MSFNPISFMKKKPACPETKEVDGAIIYLPNKLSKADSKYWNDVIVKSPISTIALRNMDGKHTVPVFRSPFTIRIKRSKTTGQQYWVMYGANGEKMGHSETIKNRTYLKNLMERFEKMGFKVER